MGAKPDQERGKYVPESIRMTTLRRYTSQSLFEIYNAASESLRTARPGFVWTIDVPDPDCSDGLYSGEMTNISGEDCRYRPWKTWFELAEALDCVLNTPRPLGDGFVRLYFRVLDKTQSCSFMSLPSGSSEKYGLGSGFERIDKFEEPNYLLDFIHALKFCSVKPPRRFLILGVNRGDEARMVQRVMGHSDVDPISILGIDHSESAIDAARQKYGSAQIRFEVGDLNDLDALRLQTYDCIIALNTLHSPHLKGQDIVRTLKQKHLAREGSFILGFPNDYYQDHSHRFGAQVKNYRQPELSHLLKNVMSYRRYFHQQRFVVKVYGKYTVLVVARRLAA